MIRSVYRKLPTLKTSLSFYFNRQIIFGYISNSKYDRREITKQDRLQLITNMSDSDNESNLPSQAECLQRCTQFAELTGTDKALAMFYLQERNWDLERSVNDYFEATGISEGATDFTTKVTDKPAPPSSTTSSSTSSSTSSTTSSSPQSTTVKDTEPRRIRLLSWNIDGLDQQNRESRTKAVCELILREKPHIVFLQEVVEPTEKMLRQTCKGYSVLSGQEICDYYSIILLDQTYTSHQDGFKVSSYTNSVMGRNLLQVNVHVKGIKFKLMTTHLESCKEHSGNRIEQLKTAFKTITSSDTDKTVVFGGDLNLRDPEIPKANGIPDNVFDLWELSGKRPEAKFTWDMQRNDNLEFGGKFKPKCRFDRLYYRDSGPKTLRPVYFELVGLERLQSCQRFASDHWGMLVHFDKI